MVVLQRELAMSPSYKLTPFTPCPYCLSTILRCIEEWASKANRCPVCNTPIIPDETLEKSRLSVLEGHDAIASTSLIRQRRRRARGENGAFELRGSAFAQSILAHSADEPQPPTQTSPSQQSQLSQQSQQSQPVVS